MEASEFQGRIGRYHHESEAWWPPDPRPPEGAPNVLVIVLDDVGYAQLGCFGSDLDTPTFDRLAAGGLRYANFHTTALCSPTRACVLTGRNHHRVGMGRIVDLATGFPGYDARIPASCAMAPAMLTPHGYAAWAVGKWHLTPEDEEHLGATRARWPLGKGFERWYGFFPGETHQFVPALHHDNHAVDPPGTYEDGYHLTTDLVDRSIEYVEDLRNVDVDKPWFLYLAPGACHSPHQTPPGWIERYAGRFDQGWDEWRTAALAKQKAEGLLPEHAELSPRPDWVPAWADLSDQERRVYARYMEAFAAFLTHTDHEVGRLIDRLAALGELDDTLVVLLSDNGASSDFPSGSPRFRGNKGSVYEGGHKVPFVAWWPGRIAPGTESDAPAITLDIMPTLLSLAGVAPSRERPLDGVDLSALLLKGEAPKARPLFWASLSNNGARSEAMRDGPWKLVVNHPKAKPGSFENEKVELYRLDRDPSEKTDLAAQEPEQTAALLARLKAWYADTQRTATPQEGGW